MKTIIFETRTEQDVIYTTVLRFERDEQQQERRLLTVSNTITRGLKQVLRDPNPRPTSWRGSLTTELSIAVKLKLRKL